MKETCLNILNSVSLLCACQHRAVSGCLGTKPEFSAFFFFFFVSVDSVYNAQWLFLSLEMLVFGFILRRDFFFSNSEEKYTSKEEENLFVFLFF